jgi:hypothetical protein
MSPNQFIVHFPRHRLEVEMPGFFRELRVKNDLNENVSELFAHVWKIAAIDRVDQLADLVDQAAHESFVRLLLIPGTASRRAQPRNRLPQIFNRTHE